MTNIKINFYEPFRHIAGKDSEMFNYPADITLLSFISSTLPEKYGESFEKLLFDDKHNISLSLLILVNGTIIKNISDFKLSDNDEITLLLPVAGG